MRRLAVAALLALHPGPADVRVDLAHAPWQLDGRPADGAVVEPAAQAGGDDIVYLPCPKRDARWTCEFTTDEAFTARVYLDWRPGPDGLLFEMLLDGRRLSPPRDGWRPAPRDLRSDLGSAWLGRGSHLFEVLPREAAPRGALRLRALLLQRP